MYIPKHFEVKDEEKIFAFVEANGFGQLISNVDGRLFASHLPMLVSEDRTKIICHIAKQNPQYIDLDNQEALITLQGPHDYISPSWYAAAGVPSWNYQAVHIYGQCEVFHDADRLKAIVDQLTEKYEAAFQYPWQPDYNVSMLGAIVGIELTISEIQCKYKLSQNRSSQDQVQVVEKLRGLGADKLADVMANNKT